MSTVYRMNTCRRKDGLEVWGDVRMQRLQINELQVCRKGDRKPPCPSTTKAATQIAPNTLAHIFCVYFPLSLYPPHDLNS